MLDNNKIGVEFQEEKIVIMLAEKYCSLSVLYKFWKKMSEFSLFLSKKLKKFWDLRIWTLKLTPINYDISFEKKNNLVKKKT